MPWEEGLSSSALPARESLFLVVCFIGVSHILDFFFCLGFFSSRLWKYGLHKVYCTRRSLGGSGGVEVKKGQVVGSGL